MQRCQVVLWAPAARLPPLSKICGWLCKVADLPQINVKRELSPDLPPGVLVYLESFALEVEGVIADFALLMGLDRCHHDYHCAPQQLAKEACAKRRYRSHEERGHASGSCGTWGYRSLIWIHVGSLPRSSDLRSMGHSWCLLLSHHGGLMLPAGVSLWIVDRQPPGQLGAWASGYAWRMVSSCRNGPSLCSSNQHLVYTFCQNSGLGLTQQLVRYMYYASTPR